MPEQEKPQQEYVFQNSKSVTEYREEFSTTYVPELVEKDTWREEDGREIEGREYEFVINPSDSNDRASLATFRLKARQSGFTIVDKVIIPDVFPDISDSKPYVAVQFSLEGTPFF